MRCRALTAASAVSAFIFLMMAWNAAVAQYFDITSGPPGLHTIGVPQPLYIDSLWLLTIPFAILPAVWAFVAFRRRRRWLAREKVCFTCGYNLTANTSGVCPECGTAISTTRKEMA